MSTYAYDSANDQLNLVSGVPRKRLDNIESNIATVEPLSTASKAYAIGDQFVFNGLLTVATAAIAQGATITVGSGGNAELADCVADQLTQLKDALNDKLNHFVLLWSNKNLTSDFAVQNIEISNLNLYPWFLVIFRSSKNSTIQYIEIVQNNRQSIVTYFHDYSASLAPTYNNRLLQPGIETNKFYISDNSQVILTTGAHGTNNGIQIPVTIWGIH